MTTRVAPTFLLKGLDPNKLLADYRSGVFNRQPVPKSKIQIANNTAVLAPVYGSTNHSPIYCAKDRHNCSVIIATSNHSNFEIFTKTGGNLPVGGRCRLCGDDFQGIALGYPLAYREATILVDMGNGDSVYRIIYTFWVEGAFCSFECVGGHVQQILSHPADYRDTTMRDSYRMLTLLYSLTYPNAGPLRPAQDPMLLSTKGRGGSLTEEQWKDRKHAYVRTDRVVMIPLKVEYVQQNLLSSVSVSTP